MTLKMIPVLYKWEPQTSAGTQQQPKRRNGGAANGRAHAGLGHRAAETLEVWKSEAETWVDS